MVSISAIHSELCTLFLILSSRKFMLRVKYYLFFPAVLHQQKLLHLCVAKLRCFGLSRDIFSEKCYMVWYPVTFSKSQAKIDNANVLYIYIVRHLPVRRKRRKRKESANWRTRIWKRKRSSKSKKMSLEIQHWKEGMLRSLLRHHQASNRKRRRRKSRARETRRTC